MNIKDIVVCGSLLLGLNTLFIENVKHLKRHDDDLVGHILRGKSGDHYSFLNIPGMIDPSCGSEEWYDNLCRDRKSVV